MTDTLIRYAQQYETVDFLNGDPSWFMHQVEGMENQETMAFLASCLSYGSRKQFMPKIQQLLDSSEGKPYEWVRNGGYGKMFCPDDGHCFYRLYTNATMCRFLTAYRQLLTDYRTLGNYVRQNASDGFGAVKAICGYFGGKGVSVVVPKDTQSACKRVCMFLRWMVRDNSPVDLGLWADFNDRRTLIMPLDTHVLAEAMRLGLLNSRNATMSTAIKLTESLAKIFPDDPLRGDFALFGYGVSHPAANGS
ncbi:MAG: TIGR02757 family protein [Bacteroidales bacterium]|nr:TIGR02757 family protein [Bacteroidales bacterium]